MSSLVLAILSFTILFSGNARANEILEMELGSSPRLTKSNEDNYKLVVKTNLGADQEAVITVSEVAESSPEAIKQLLSNPEIQKSDILLSTDQEAVAQTVIEATNKPHDKRLLRFIPIGKLAGASEVLASGFKNYYKNVKRTITGDRIGLTVLSITVGVDSFIWLHSADIDIHQKSAMIIMNLVMAATFGLDKDLWGKINKPLKTRLISVFDRFIPTEKFNLVKTLSSQYLSNMILGMGIHIVRTGLLSFDHFNQVVTSSPFWLNAAKLSALITLTSFAWSELYSSVDIDNTPKAKMMLKRFAEMRGVIMCQLASISMVLQPHIYGFTPTYSFIIHGALGVIALANSHRIINWLETNKLVDKIYKKVETFENFINSGIENLNAPRGGATIMCRSLFAN